MLGAITHRSSTGAFVAAGGGRCLGVVLTAGASAAATLTLRDSGDNSGETLLVLAAPQGASATFTVPFRFAVGLHGTLSGTGAVASVVT